ncbi:hypothetical protein BCR43DRAFT_497784 [Syncephalastrum racemosum]|uniref:Uncharacterized protein n=1 Tax=Syncephalastrum racemosum TaxID=13706 RepID=A0A1X2H2Q9_SYNRA|nr:hypothetical protein BCR43DRAFT_497784 [Syncephalastrum racemosum]
MYTRVEFCASSNMRIDDKGENTNTVSIMKTEPTNRMSFFFSLLYWCNGLFCLTWRKKRRSTEA